jgi:hypothetical protein
LRRCAILGNRRAMRPLAVMDKRPADRAGGAPGSESRPFGFARRAFASNYRARASQTFAGNDAKDSRNDSYAIPWRILKPNIYYNAHNFAPGPTRPELSRQEPRRLLSAGRRAMKANSSISQSTSGRAWRLPRPCRSGQPMPAFLLKRPGSGMVEGGSCEG